MAGSMRCCFMRLNLGLLRKNVGRHMIFNQSRTLFSEQSLGLTAYLNLRERYKKQFLNLEESFREKMVSYVKDNTTGMIFSEDLKVMVHLLENTPQDVDLITKMLKKFNSQNNDMRFGSYTFGPVVMRAFHRTNNYELANQLFNDPELALFFNQLSTYQVYLDLLYRNKQYAQMRNAYDVIQERLTDGRTHPRNSLILVTAGLYKDNTPESFKYGMNLWKELHNRGYPIIRRVLTHISALAIKQGQSHVALEILASAKKPRYIGIRCLKIMAFVDIGRLNDVIPFFRNAIELDNSTLNRETYFKDTIELVEAAVEKQNLGPDDEIVQLLKLIRNGGLVQETTLDEHIDTEIDIVEQLRIREQNKARNQQSNYENSGAKFGRRPGLRDLV